MPRRGHHQEKIVRALKQADAGVNGGESGREHGLRIEETYVRVKGQGRYLYRALDSTGATIDFFLSAKRDAAAARRFLPSLGRNQPFAPRGSSTPANLPLSRSPSQSSKPKAHWRRTVDAGRSRTSIPCWILT